ncbi:hypothetical protein D9M69_731320 [compost metagenome]
MLANGGMTMLRVRMKSRKWLMKPPSARAVASRLPPTVSFQLGVRVTVARVRVAE